MRELVLQASGEWTYGGAVVCQDGRGQWRAWIPDGPGSKSGRELTPCLDLEDLLDRLDELAAVA